MDISIQKADAYRLVEILTTRAGRGSELFDKIVLTEDGYALLDEYVGGAINEAAQSRLLTGAILEEVTEGATQKSLIVLHAKVDENYLDKAVQTALETQLKLYVAYYLSAAWIEPASGELSKSMAESAAHTLETLGRLLTKRVSPKGTGEERVLEDAAQAGSDEAREESYLDKEEDAAQAGSEDAGIEYIEQLQDTVRIMRSNKTYMS